MRVRQYASQRRKTIGATAAALILVGASAAVAATLTVTVTDAGAGSGSVSACDSSIDLALGAPTYNASIPGYEITTVDYSNVDGGACFLNTLVVTVADASNVSLASGDDAIAGSEGTITLSAGVPVDDAVTVYAAIYE